MRKILLEIQVLLVQFHQQTPTQYGLWHLEHVEAEIVTGGEDEMGGNWLGLSGGAVCETYCVCWAGEGIGTWEEAGLGTAVGMCRGNCGELPKQRLACNYS
jgi:hypothetical protein